MSNLSIFLIFALVNFALIALVFKLFGKRGILSYIVLSVIAANLQVNKVIVFDFGLFELQATLGNVMFAGIFLATDLLNEKYGYKEAKKSVHVSIYANLAFIVLMFISTLFHGLEDSQNVNEALNLFFSINGGALKAVLVGNFVYFISQSLDVLVYSKIKEWNPSSKYLWLRNNGSTFISQFIDSVLVTIGFALVGIFPMAFVVNIIITTLIVKYIAAIIDTPFMYLMSRIRPRSGIDEG
ncbi:queuosine precursor transporter [Vallitalea pronyensis]|uniref:Probable queuosine precursor transporter n=1 Tax=Vallitalea pronyensis TaxID=1348613 RepID=A0A8J8MKC2_9FIRM|nr:queuosine precursor transporter [Vallitalea pronyensis]QUI23017.1 queuosine precursor transporter [Vallitalea pronyensis]